MSMAEALAEFERKYLTTLLALTGGKMSEMVRLSGKRRTSLPRILRRNGFVLINGQCKNNNDARWVTSWPFPVAVANAALGSHRHTLRPQAGLHQQSA